jgi:hypothetical protein
MARIARGGSIVVAAYPLLLIGLRTVTPDDAGPPDTILALPERNVQAAWMSQSRKSSRVVSQPFQ